MGIIKVDSLFPGTTSSHVDHLGAHLRAIGMIKVDDLLPDIMGMIKVDALLPDSKPSHGHLGTHLRVMGMVGVDALLPDTKPSHVDLGAHVRAMGMINVARWCRPRRRCEQREQGAGDRR